MTTRASITVVGVHPVREAHEPCYLIEVEVDGAAEPDFTTITQEDPARPSTEWQVAYDERQVPERASKTALGGTRRYAFFFHYLDLTRPLLVGGAFAELPPPSAVPEHLSFISYEEP